MKLILKSSAGTGKTYRLSLEYIKLLLSGVDFQDILVTTFTKKATQEIRDRIFSHLKELSKNSNFIKRELSNIGFTGIIDRAKIIKIYVEMLSNKDKIKIYTIDSFINSIFNSVVVPYFNLYGYKMIDGMKNSEYMEDILEKIIQKHFNEINRFFSMFLEKDVSHYTKWIADFLKNRWKILLVKKRKRSVRGSADIGKSFQNVLDSIEACLSDKEDKYIDSYVKEDFKELLLVEDRVDLIEKRFSNFLGYKGDKGIWNGVKLRKNVNNAKEFDILVERYNQFKKDLSAHIFNKHFIPLEKDILKVAEIIFDEYDKIKFEKRELTYNDILIYTYIFMYNFKSETVDVFKNLLDKKEMHVMIDEFQDTSILQWLILKPIIDNALSFVAVGDDKQAIYGWRGGEKDLFVNLGNILNASHDVLNTCYRSGKEILYFTNNFFANLGIQKENVRYIKSKKSYLEVSLKERKDVKRALVDRIKEVDIRRDCVILARSNNDIEELAAFLKEANIPFVKESSLSVIDHAAVKPIFSLLKFISMQDISELLKFLRSDLINISSSEMKIILEKRIEVQLYVNDEAIQPKISERCDKIMQMIKDIKRQPFQNMIKSVIRDFGFLNFFNHNSEAKNINHFYEISRSFSDLILFLEYVVENRDAQNLRQVAIDDDSIKLMTIHKAKGLEFKTVFLMWNFSTRSGMVSRLSCNLDFDDKYEKVEDYFFTSNEMKQILKYYGKNYQKLEKDKELAEEFNSLYVAMTRAKQNLFCFLSFDRNLKMIDSLKVSLSESDDYIFKIRKSLLTSTGYKKLHSLSIQSYIKGEIVRDEEVDKIESSSLLKENMLQYNIESINSEKSKNLKDQKNGTMVHYYLSFIKNDFNLNQIKRWTVNKFLDTFDEQYILSVLQRLEKFIASSPVFKLKKGDQVFTEYSIFDDQEYRVDRIVFNEEEKRIDIYDYKTGKYSEEQLENYKKILMKKYPEYKIKSEIVKV